MATYSQLPQAKLKAFGLGRLGLWSSVHRFVLLVLVVVVCLVLICIFQVTNRPVTNYLATQVAPGVQEKVLGIGLDMPFAEANRRRFGALINFLVIPAENFAQVLVLGINWLATILTVLAFLFVWSPFTAPFLPAVMLMYGMGCCVSSFQGVTGYQFSLFNYSLSNKQMKLAACQRGLGRT